MSVFLPNGKNFIRKCLHSKYVQVFFTAINTVIHGFLLPALPWLYLTYVIVLGYIVLRKLLLLYRCVLQWGQGWTQPGCCRNVSCSCKHEQGALCAGFCWGLLYVAVVAAVGQLRASSMVYIQHLTALHKYSDYSDNLCSAENNLLLLPMALYICLLWWDVLCWQNRFILFFRNFECSEMKWLFLLKVSGYIDTIRSIFAAFIDKDEPTSHVRSKYCILFYFFSHSPAVSNWFSVEMWC